MKAELIIYKVLSYLLLPFAALLGLNCVSAIIPAFGNPILLLLVFLFACVTIYIIASYIFLSRGIDKTSARKPVLRDLIRINGVITLTLCLTAIYYLPGVHLKPADAKSLMEQMEAQNHLQFGLTVPQFLAFLNGFFSFVTGLSIILIVHIAITFHLLRRFSHLFGTGNADAG